MCEESSGWFYKARVVEELRKKQQRAETLKQESKPAPSQQHAKPETHIKERETVPV